MTTRMQRASVSADALLPTTTMVAATRQAPVPEAHRASATVTRFRLCAAAALLLAALQAPSVLAAPPSDRELLQSVASRLIAVAPTPSGVVWPPLIRIQDSDAVAAYTFRDHGDTIKITLSQGILSHMVEGDPDRLALLIGHEVAHVLLGHVTSGPNSLTTPFVHAAFSREQEFAADRRGMELALAAGYSYQAALKGFHRMLELGLEYSSFEGLGIDHPSWKERLAALDEQQASLWRAMTAFSDGAVFLAIEQYVPAERCYRAVLEEFPGCYEALSNLGYAVLMQYCDALDQADLRRFDIGQIVVGGFYRRPASLEAQVRGANYDLWWDAVGDLRQALVYRTDLILAKATLGIAYLVGPGGRDLGQATRFLQEAAAQADTAKSLDPLARAAVLINAGVVDIAAGRVDEGERKFQSGEQLGRSFAAQVQRVAPSLGISQALIYNRAVLLGRSPRRADQTRAVEQLAQYLRIASQASAWWNLAYEDYQRLCGTLGVPALEARQLAPARHHSLRRIASVALGSDRSVTLAEPLADVRARLGPGESMPLVPGTNLVRVRYPQQGVELLATESVLAICLRGEHAPELLVRESGLGAGEAASLRVNMPADELDSILADEDYDFRQLADTWTNYRFYRQLGLAVLVREGHVRELVVAEVPEREILGTR